MTTKQTLQEAYIHHVLTQGSKPASVYLFAKQLEITEQEFYNFYASFEAIEQDVWAQMAHTTITEITAQQTWATYTVREKLLSFFYSFFELAKSQRSFITYSLQKAHKGFALPNVLIQFKTAFDDFTSPLLKDGIESGELADRKLISNRYKDAIWVQLMFVLNFWIHDSSAGFEKTDEAIERGVNITFDLLQRSPIDSLIDYGKFLATNSGFKQKMGL